MAVNLHIPDTVAAISGVRLGAVAAGIRYSDRLDLTLVEIHPDAQVAGVFTTNAFRAAPVLVAQEHLRQGAAGARFLVINTGCANAGTGERGMNDARQVCQGVADICAVEAQTVLPFSTGVIGEPLPVERILVGLPAAKEALTADGWHQAARAIMTTDTQPKLASREVQVGGKPVRITGMAKGAGMIRPDMATMLAFIATDAALEQPVLQTCLKQAVDASFNRVTVDGDTSTNDACILIATGQSEAPTINAPESEHYEAVAQGVREVAAELAQALIRDGEGATKFVTVQVEQGRSREECLEIAYTVAHSPLVKTALFASDPNWGRILAAVGRAKVDGLDTARVDLWLNDVQIVTQGGRAEHYTEEAGQKVMDLEEITIRILLGRGEARETVWTSDFSHDYVTINAEYRT